MHIVRVELENIKSHTHASFEFHRGTTAITGQNGAGKTTIIEAIAWTLFDLQPYKPIDNFVRRGAKKGAARVTFESHLDGRRYTVIRDTGTKYQVYDNELKTVVADKKAEVSRFLQQHLGVEPGTDLETLFRSAIGVPQGTLTADFLRTPGERKPKFDRLLKVEEYREGAEKLLETKRFVENRLQDARTKIAVAENELSRFEETENQHRETERKVAELSEILNSLRGQIAQKGETVARFERAETLVNETRSRLDKSEVRLESARAAEIRVQAERDQAAAALAAQTAVEADYNSHVSALNQLNVLDAQQIERNRIQTEASRAESFLNEAKSELKRLEENLARAVEAAREAQSLQPKIAEQTGLEAERDELQRRKISAEQAQKEVADLEAEIGKRRDSHRETRKQIEQAQLGADAAGKIGELETKRREIEDRLKKAVEAEASLKVLEPQSRQLKNEIQTLRENLRRSESETSGFETVSRLAREAADLNRKENTLVAEIARLQAKIQHDEKFRGEVRNGLCPILSQKCLNIGEGETLESYFHHELSSNYDRLGNLEREQKNVGAHLAAAREAERKLGQLENLRQQLEETRRNLSLREENLKTIESKIAAFNNFKPEVLSNLKTQREEIEREISELNVAAGKYAGLESLRQSLAQIESEGKRKRDEQNRFKEIAAQLPEIENGLNRAKNKLNELNNPRERAVSLKREAERETVLRTQIETAKNNLTEKERLQQNFAEQLRGFDTLDAELARVRAERDRTLPAYHTFLANKAVAATLPQRDNELARAVEETERLEKEFQTISLEYQNAAENYNHEQHLTEKSALLDLERRAAAAASEYESEKRREADLRREIERLSAIRKQMQREFTERERLDRISEATDFIRDTLKRAAPEVAKSYLFSISREANEIFREITGSAERTLRWTEDYEIVLEELGHERPFPNLSGGEQMAAALSVRLALLKQLSDVRVAFFDEPTTNLDRERRERLAQQIGQITSFDQLFVISHDDTFDDVGERIRVPEDGIVATE